jgi:formylglycine-generating enzyme required for sulfatase activity
MLTETQITPTLTFTPDLPTETNTPFFTPTATPLSDEITDAKGIRMNLVPAGTFTMGSKKYPEEKPIHDVYLDSYYMDIYEVTNATYKECVSDGICELPDNLNGKYGGINEYNDPKYANHPVVFIYWNMAKSYCEWRDARLPTEAEWEKAARGTDGRTYPWGENIDTTYASFLNLGYINNNTTAVGSYEKGKSPYGMYDMANNVLEWVNDWYNDTYYQNSPSSNPLGPADIRKYHVLRGGSGHSGSGFEYRSAARSGYDPYIASSIGFRCAQSP